MKKYLILALAVVLTLGLAAGICEQTEDMTKKAEEIATEISPEASEMISKAELETLSMGEFTVTTVVPDGYSLVERWENETLYVGELRSEDQTQPRIDVTVAYNDEFAGVTITDLTEESLERIRDAEAEDGQKPEVSMAKTEYGTVIVISRINNEYESRADMFSLYKGYEISMFIQPGVAAAEGISDDQINLWVKFLSNLWITSNK